MPTIAVEMTMPIVAMEPTGQGAVAQDRQIHMQGAGKKQEGEHAIEHGRLKVDLPNDPSEVLVEEDIGEGEFDADEHKRGAEPHDEQADRVRQADETMIDPAKRGRQDQQDG